MKKGFIISIILIAILGFLIGLYVYKISKLDNIEIADSNFSVVTDECTKIAELYELGMLETVETTLTKEAVSPNTNIIFKTYYKDCGHIITTKKSDISDLVNLSEKEIQKKYMDWKIDKFSTEEIVLFKEVNRFCDEHYVLREEEGYLVIYKLDEDNKETLLQKTDIFTKYLAEEDLKKIQNGFRINTKSELNKILEDYE